MKTSFSTRIPRHTVTRARRSAATARVAADEAKKVADTLGDDDSRLLANHAELCATSAADLAELVSNTFRGAHAIEGADKAGVRASQAKADLRVLRSRFASQCGGVAVEVVAVDADGDHDPRCGCGECLASNAAQDARYAAGVAS